MLEGELADKKVRRLLVATDIVEGHSAGAVAVGILYASSDGCRLMGGLGSQLFPGGLASGGLAGFLIRACHCTSEYPC